MTRVEFYIKGEENTTKNKNRDVEEHTSGNTDTSPISDKTPFKQSVKIVKSLTPLNTLCEQIWREVIHMHDIS